MKNSKKYITIVFLFVLIVSGCRKNDSNLDVNMSDYPENITVMNETDQWITDHFITPWNIQVVYRYDRSKADVGRNISPVDINKVIPVLQVIDNIFIKPYAKIGGETFGKKYFHKEWVLYGSPSYNNDGSYILGTSSNARTMTLYVLNSFNASSPDMVKSYMRTVYHEFTHALNQTIPIPPAFQAISVPDYEPDWTNVSTASANALGFVTPYAGSAYTEDFAETVAHIVVEGPIWYSNLLNTVGVNSLAYNRFKQKEAMAYQYMLNNFNVVIYALQKEVRQQLKDLYNVQDPTDITQGFGFRLAGNKVNTIVIDPAAAHYTTYGSSAAFNTVLNSYKNGLQAGNWYMKYIQFTFSNDSTAIFRVAFAQGAAGTTVYFGDYNFRMKVNPVNGIVTFSRVLPDGTGTTYDNGRLATVLSPFEQYILPYLTNRQFVAAYLPTTLPSTDPLYKSFAGFYVNGTSTNYFYGPVTYK